MPAFKEANNNGKITWFFKCYYVDYTGSHRQKKMRGFRTKKEALAAEHSFFREQVPRA